MSGSSGLHDQRVRAGEEPGTRKLKNLPGLRFESSYETMGKYLAQCPAHGNPTNATLVFGQTVSRVTKEDREGVSVLHPTDSR